MLQSACSFRFSRTLSLRSALRLLGAWPRGPLLTGRSAIERWTACRAASVVLRNAFIPVGLHRACQRRGKRTHEIRPNHMAMEALIGIILFRSEERRVGHSLISRGSVRGSPVN